VNKKFIPINFSLFFTVAFFILTAVTANAEAPRELGKINFGVNSGIRSGINMSVVQIDSKVQIIFEDLKKSCTAEYIAEGAREVLDCPEIAGQTNKVLALKTNPFIKQIRLGTHPDKLRMVFDLAVTKEPLLKVSREDKRSIFTLSFEPVGLDQASLEPVSIEPVALDKGSFDPPSPEEKVLESPVKPTEQPISISHETSGEKPLSVESQLVNFVEGERLIKDVSVTNTSGSQLSVTVDAYPFVSKRSEAALDSDTGVLDTLALDTLAPDTFTPDTFTLSPRKFTLGAGQTRSIRLLLVINDNNLKTDFEREFKVRFSDEEGNELAPQILAVYSPKLSLPKLVARPLWGKIQLKK